jgi:hypothetical protein
VVDLGPTNHERLAMRTGLDVGEALRDESDWVGASWWWRGDCAIGWCGWPGPV